MLNANNERELAYVVTIDGIDPIPGYDRVEHATVGGWRVIVQKDQFKVGDPAIYFEIDSRVPADKECFAFLEKRNYKVKTLKMCKVLSQGLLMHANDFGWNNFTDPDGRVGVYDSQDHTFRYADDESRFVTQKLGVTYADAEDNQRKAPSADKYKKMAQRHPAIFRKPFVRWLMKRTWGKKILFVLFGKKKDKKNGWPEWVAKTDEERVQNMPWILNDTGDWIVTEKIDGSSTTFTMKRGKHRKNDFYVCSRNVCFDSVDRPCYYDTNIYWEMAQKYDMFNVLNRFLMNHPESQWVTIQGETYGAGVQRRDYSIEDHDFRAFNLITSDKGRWGTLDMIVELNGYEVPCVPVVDSNFKFDGLDVDGLLAMADGNSKLDGKPREGFVLRSLNGQKSFKAVSNSFLLKFHG